MMITEEMRQTINAQFNVKKILWIALTVGLLLYFAAVYIITTGKTPSANFPPQTDYVFAAIGCVLFILAIILRRHLISEKKLKDALNNLNPDNQIQNVDHNDWLKKYLSKQQILYIISLGINDSIGILGIGIGFISRDVTKALPYIVVALILNAWIFPRKEVLINKLNNMAINS